MFSPLTHLPNEPVTLNTCFLGQPVPNPTPAPQLRMLGFAGGGVAMVPMGRGGAGPTLKRSVFSRSSTAFRDTFPVNLSMEKIPRGSSSTPGPWML